MKRNITQVKPNNSINRIGLTNVLLIVILGVNIMLGYRYRSTTEYCNTEYTHHQVDAPIFFVYDHKTDSELLPKQFRTFAQMYKTKSPSYNGSYIGLEDLKVSGGQQPSASQFIEINKNLDYKLGAVLDLRKESHVILNGIPVSWYGRGNAANVHKTTQQVEQDQLTRLNELRQLEGQAINVSHIIKEGIRGDVDRVRTEKILVSKVSSEKELLASMGIKYHRFYITDHHGPTVAELDKFVRFVLDWNVTQFNSSKPYLYLHCRGGFGRTTSMMSVFDMIFNSKRVSLKDILDRNVLSGGRNLIAKYNGIEGEIKMKDPGIVGTYRHYRAILRYDRLKHFYKYCKTNSDGFETSYAEYTTITQQ
ncbi:hypothetical protein AKO1_015064 [Acrasis kona]|uniref:Tyrosine specific protein phosphatases domain-containing protein n=1 Tax=Acrasis kona TaxID=1008807 RepID=A0AAW2ZLN3_9EUKA